MKGALSRLSRLVKLEGIVIRLSERGSRHYREREVVLQCIQHRSSTEGLMSA